MKLSRANSDLCAELGRKLGNMPRRREELLHL